MSFRLFLVCVYIYKVYIIYSKYYIHFWVDSNRPVHVEWYWNIVNNSAYISDKSTLVRSIVQVAASENGVSAWPQNLLPNLIVFRGCPLALNVCMYTSVSTLYVLLFGRDFTPKRTLGIYWISASCCLAPINKGLWKTNYVAPLLPNNPHQKKLSPRTVYKYIYLFYICKLMFYALVCYFKHSKSTDLH